MIGRVELIVNGKVWIGQEVTKWERANELIKQYKNGFVSTLNDTDKWEIALTIPSDFSRRNQKPII